MKAKSALILIENNETFIKNEKNEKDLEQYIIDYKK